MARDLQQYATDALAEAVVYACTGFTAIDDATREIEDIEPEFDGESYCPYYRQQVDVIAAYESEFGGKATEITGDSTYKAEDWQQAQTAYAYAVAYAAHNSYFEAAKLELIEGLEEFKADAVSELELDDTPEIRLSMTCTHGWAAHDRELANGTMVFDSKQLDGCNGLAREIGGLWVSCCVDPAAKVAEEETETA